ncbi:hypothetical protein JCM3770_000353 [Rhodotorula araucariae]
MLPPARSPARRATQRLFAGAAVAGVALCCAASPALAQNFTVDYDLTTTEFNRTAWQRQPYVSNGYIGQRIPAEGFGYMEVKPNNLTGRDGTQGWPLFTPRQAAAMVAGFYDQQNETAGTNFGQEGGQQPISTLPTWSSLYFTVNNQTYSTATPDAQISNWTQSMSIQDGVVRTSLDWTPEGATEAIHLTYTILAHRVEPNIGAVRLTVEGLNENMQVAFTDVFDGAGAWRTDFVSSGPVPNTTNTLHTAVRPVGISNVTAYEVSIVDIWPHGSSNWQNDTGTACLGDVLTTNVSTASTCYRLVSGLPANGTLDVIKYVGIASSDAYPGVELQTALAAANKANSTGWEGILSSHREAWNAVWEDADIEIPGEENEDLQLVTRASLFHVLTNVRNGTEPTGLGDNSIAPAGLTSDSYAGHIFWDADVWIAPSFISLFPDYAESVIDFRYRQLGAAKENAKEYGLAGSLYPWTGARFGNCTGIGPCADYQYHLNSDIALAAWQYFAVTNDTQWLEEKGYPLVRGAADMFASFVTRNDTGNGTYQYVTLNTTGADEYANHVNNTGLTNGALTVTFTQAMELGKIIGQEDFPANWTDIREKILIPKKNGIILGYDGTNGSAEIKQADVVLLQYPYEFQWPNTSELAGMSADSVALTTLDFYAGANSPDGPSMTWGIYSIIASELSPIGCSSYTYFLRASQPYSRAPYYQFSEQQNDVWAANGGTNPAFTFLTGHGGYLQTLTHGFTGYRFRLDRLHFDPILPPQLSNYTVKGMKWHGGVFDVNVNTNETTITYRRGANGTVPVEIGRKNDKTGNYTLALGESLTVPTRSTTGTLIEGNLAQCQSTLGDDAQFHLVNSTSRPGEFALAAIDGSNSTVWQPYTPDPTSMVVDLGKEQPIKAFHLNWGNEPPQSYSIAVSNTSELAGASAVASGNVTLSAPYDLAQSLIVQVDLGNLTDVPLAAPVTARYVQLTIEGSYATKGYGGTVGEFAVIGA